jgi:hypothetical protein
MQPPTKRRTVRPNGHYNNPNASRPRHHNNGKPNGSNPRNHSRGPREEQGDGDVFVGSKTFQRASQTRDRYLELAKEAATMGDRITAESYYQHADHYARIVNSAKENQPRAEPVARAAEPRLETWVEAEDESMNEESVIAISHPVTSSVPSALPGLAAVLPPPLPTIDDEDE